MTDERLPDGPDLHEMLQLLTDTFPEAVIARIDSAAFLSLDESHWPNFATVVWTDEHDQGAPSSLSRLSSPPSSRARRSSSRPHRSAW